MTGKVFVHNKNTLHPYMQMPQGSFFHIIHTAANVNTALPEEIGEVRMIGDISYLYICTRARQMKTFFPRYFALFIVIKLYCLST